MGKPGKPKVLPKFNSQVGVLIGKCLHGIKRIGIKSIDYRGAVIGKTGKPQGLPKI